MFTEEMAESESEIPTVMIRTRQRVDFAVV